MNRCNLHVNIQEKLAKLEIIKTCKWFCSKECSEKFAKNKTCAKLKLKNINNEYMNCVYVWMFKSGQKMSSRKSSIDLNWVFHFDFLSYIPYVNITNTLPLFFCVCIEIHLKRSIYNEVCSLKIIEENR